MSLKVDRLASDVVDPLNVIFNTDCHLNILPADITNYILLKAFDPYKPNSLVCRRFRQFFNKQIKTWRRYFITTENFENFFVAFPNIKSLDTFRYLLPGVIDFLQKQRIEEITIQGESLSAEDINSPIPPLEILNELTSLKKVTIINSIPNFQGLFCTKLPHSITRLSLINIETAFRVPKCDNLQHLNITHCPGIATESIHFPILKTLVWEPVPQIDPQLVSHIFKYDCVSLLGQFGSDVEWTKRFIEEGGDINVQFGKQRQTPLFWACTGRISLLQSLIAHGANVHARDWNDSTPLHRAVFTNSEEAVYCLIYHGASVHARDNSLGTPLHDCRNPAIMRALLKAGADPNAKNFLGATPLMKAVINGHEALLPILLAAGARVSEKDYKGQTVLDIAQDPNYSDSIRKILRDSYQAEQAP